MLRRNIPLVQSKTFGGSSRNWMPSPRKSVLALESAVTQSPAGNGKEPKKMAWKTPKIVEVPVGMEINMYACAARK